MAGRAALGLGIGSRFGGVAFFTPGKFGVCAGGILNSARRCSNVVVVAKQRDPAQPRPKSPSRASSLEKGGRVVDGRVFDYVQAHTREPEILRELRKETNEMRGGQMQVTKDQAQLLATLVQLMGAKFCIEVGVFTGYSALAVALALPDSGRLVACDRSEESLAVAQKYFGRAGVSHKLDVKLGLAIDSLDDLLLQGGTGRYDFAFIDADKRMYQAYYEKLLQLVKTGGLIVVDNVLWRGTVADPEDLTEMVESIRSFNAFLLNDERIDYNLVTVGDGMALCRKL